MCDYYNITEENLGIMDSDTIIRERESTIEGHLYELKRDLYCISSGEKNLSGTSYLHDVHGDDWKRVNEIWKLYEQYNVSRFITEEGKIWYPDNFQC